MNRVALRALLSHWRRQPLQLVTLIAGLALATALWSAVQALNSEARSSYARAAEVLGQSDMAILRTEGDLPLATYVRLRRAGWQVSPVLEGQWRRLTVTGVDLLTHPLRPVPRAADADLSPPELLLAPGRLFAAPQTAQRLKAPGLPPVIATDDLPPGQILTDLAVAERLLERPGMLSHLLVHPNQPPGLTPLAQLAPELHLTPPEAGLDNTRMTDSFHLNLTAFGLLSFAVGLFIVQGAIGLSFAQRRGVFRTLRALGLPQRRLMGLLIAEILLFALLAGALGLGLGYGVAAALLPDVSASLRGLYGAAAPGSLSLRPVWIVSGLGMALLGAALAGAQGLWQLARLPILSAPGTRAWAAVAATQTRRMALAGLVLLALGGLSLWLFEGLLAGFALLGGVMLGAALILPALLHGGLSLIRVRGALGGWMLADMRAALPSLSLALMALMLALATNIGVGTMVSSFRLTFVGWLDQRMAAEFYVTARSDSEGAALARWLGPRVDAVLPIRATQTRLFGAPAEVYGILDHATYRENWPLLRAAPQVWERLAQAQGVLINEQLARRAALAPGDPLEVLPDWELPVLGIYSDYGNPRAQVITALPALEAKVPDLPQQRYGLRLPPEDVPALREQISQRFDLPPRAMIDQSALKQAALQVFERTFVITTALNVLTLLVAGFAILTSLLTLWSSRLPQVAPLWALGITRARLARFEMARSLILAALSALLALPLGLVLAYVLLAVINVEAFGWRLPMFLFPGDWALLFAAALGAAALAAALPVLRLRRVPPADLLKVFANDR